MRDSNRTYDGIRRLAIIDAKRRISSLKHLGLRFEVQNLEHNDDNDVVIEKRLYYIFPEGLDNEGLSRNEYAQLREIKYIVWRFEITETELFRNERR